MAKVLAFVGASGSGKTTLIEKLIPKLMQKDVIVTTIKHTHHIVSADREGSDTERHQKAGALSTALVGPNLLILRTSSEVQLQKVVDIMALDCDLILLEGFKTCSYPKIEVVRGREPVLQEDQVLLTATDHSLGRQNEVSLSDETVLLDLIVKLLKS